MGTDIHGVFQRSTTLGWEDVPTLYEFDRHYLLFAWLADVRNGFGFAGVKTFVAIEPISKPRGLPPDFEGGENHPVSSLELMGWRAKYHKPGEELSIWMGDHSFSWLTSEEILSSLLPSILKTGVITLAAFQTWDGKEPGEYSGDIWGKDIVISLPTHITPLTTHVRVDWEREASEELSYFLTEVKRLVSLHGPVRFVFGFDS